MKDENAAVEAIRHALKALRNRHLAEEAAHAPAINALSRPLAYQICEADISRLSFAVELAEEFYGRVKGQDVAFEPAKLLWLIQRDFLEGKSVQEMVKEALNKVLNANGDKYIDQVNQIRESLVIMGDNSTAFSLPQPHLQRTKFCELDDTELDPSYIEKREKLKELVGSIARPKIVHGKGSEWKEKAEKLKLELQQCYKSQSVLSEKLAVEVAGSRTLRPAIQEKDSLIADLQKEVTELRGECSQLNSHLEEKAEAIELVVSENNELKKQIEEAILKAKTVEDENKMLIDRWMLQKMQDAERLNEVQGALENG